MEIWNECRRSVDGCSGPCCTMIVPCGRRGGLSCWGFWSLINSLEEPLFECKELLPLDPQHGSAQFSLVYAPALCIGWCRQSRRAAREAGAPALWACVVFRVPWGEELPSWPAVQGGRLPQQYLLQACPVACWATLLGGRGGLVGAGHNPRELWCPRLCISTWRLLLHIGAGCVCRASAWPGGLLCFLFLWKRETPSLWGKWCLNLPIPCLVT